jgi:hypothetical protein
MLGRLGWGGISCCSNRHPMNGIQRMSFATSKVLFRDIRDNLLTATNVGKAFV